MTTEQLAAKIDAKLAEIRKQLLAQNGVPVFMVGYDGDGKRGRFVVAWATTDPPDLTQAHQLLTAMRDDVAAKLGVT